MHNQSTERSAQLCGCDLGCNHLCERHQHMTDMALLMQDMPVSAQDIEEIHEDDLSRMADEGCPNA